MKKKNSDLLMRSLTYGCMTMALIFLIVLAQHPLFRWVFTLFVSLMAATAFYEYAQLLKKKALQPATLLGMGMVVLYIFSLFFKTQGSFEWQSSYIALLPEIVLGMALFFLFFRYAFPTANPILNISTTFLGIVYIAIPLGLTVQIIYFFKFYGHSADLHLEGIWWIAYLILVTKSADTGGYFVGRNFGKHKLILWLSPNKTFEGAIGGLIAAIFVSLLLVFLGKYFGNVFKTLSYIHALWLGALVGVLSQVGDLAESLLKRDAAVKDSNHIPGIGGVLDMVDSLFLTAPLVYLFLRIHYA